MRTVQRPTLQNIDFSNLATLQKEMQPSFMGLEQHSCQNANRSHINSYIRDIKLNR